MSESPYIFEGTQGNFAALVLENSAKGPVLVNYWAPWAGPCLRLWPILSKLAVEYGGRFLLVNVNTDSQTVLVKERGVKSLPTVQIFRDGRVLNEVRGAESEHSLRRLLERFAVRPSDTALGAAVTAYRQGRRDEGLAALEEAAASDPDNRRISLTHAKLLLRAGDYEGARRVLARLPAEERNQREVSGMLAHLDFLQAVQRAQDPAELVEAIARNPRDMEARYRLTAVRLLEDDYPGAMDQLLEILRAAPDFREGAARRGLLAVFNLLGSDHELVARYRARLFEISDWPAPPHEA